jgi:hypothetical protein
MAPSALAVAVFLFEDRRRTGVFGSWEWWLFSHKSRRKIAASNIGPIVKPASWLAPEETAGGFCGGLPQRCE